MGKLQYCSGLSGRRLFMRNTVLLGVGAWLFGASVGAAQAAEDEHKAAQGKGAFVVVNGWVLPSRYLRDSQP